MCKNRGKTNHFVDNCERHGRIMSWALEKWTTNHKGIIIKMKRLTFWLEDFLKDVGFKIEYLKYIGVLIGIPITKMEGKGEEK